MKTTRRRLLAGTIGAVGLFLAGPAIRPTALALVEPEQPPLDEPIRPNHFDFTLGGIRRMIETRFGHRRLDPATVLEIRASLDEMRPAMIAAEDIGVASARGVVTVSLADSLN